MNKPTSNSKAIHKWIDKYIAKPNDKIGGFPVCPFINRYRKQIQIVETDDPSHVVENFSVFHQQFGIEAVICHGFDWDYDSLEKFTNKVNRKYKKKDVMTLFMHPDTEEEPLPIHYTFNKAPLVIIQRISVLESARKSLKKTDYYSYYKE